MSIRTLFLMLVGILALLVGVQGYWQITDSNQKIQRMEWLKKANQLTNHGQRVTVELAVERGVTAYILENLAQEYASEKERLFQERAKVNEQLELLMTTLQELQAITPSYLLLQSQRQVVHTFAKLSEWRELVDISMAQGQPRISIEQWIANISELNEEIHGVSGISLFPLASSIYSYAAQPLMQNVLFTMAEYLGRERAMLVVAISRGTPLTEQEQQTLAMLRLIFDHAQVRSQRLVEQLHHVPWLQQEHNLFQQELVAYRLLRDRALNRSQDGRPYEIDPDVWFEQATRTIQSIYQMSYRVAEQLEKSVQLLKEQAEQTRLFVIAVLTALLILLALVGYLLNKRIVKPLGRLTHAANAIASGVLDHPLAHERVQEIAQLATAFENMRQQLQDDHAQHLLQGRELNKLYTVVDQSVVAILITDAEGTVEYANSEFEKTTGYSLVELHGEKAGKWSSGETLQSSYQEMWSTIKAGKVWMGELLNKRKSGEYYWAMASISPVRDENGVVTHFINIHLDISEHKRIAERLNYVSHYNQTTNLPNRQLLQQRFLEAQQQQNTQIGNLALVALSIGRLKHINASMGWKIGDSVLREAGSRLQKMARDRDTVSHQEGGKFTVLLHPVQNAAEAMLLTQKMVEALAEPILIEGQKLYLTPKTGVCLLAANEPNFEQQLKNADTALHVAEQSLECCSLYSEDMDSNVQKYLELESALADALKHDEFVLHYQPKVDIQSGNIIAVEALLRWKNSQTGEFVSPDVFIPAAEKSGLIVALGEWVLTTSCQQAKAWQDEGLPNLVMAVNVSAKQLVLSNFPQTVSEILSQTGLAPEFLELELTESIFVDDPDQALTVLERFKAIGVRLSIDDFGTGYSSLSYLSWLPVDTLKIDRSFVENITTDLRASAIATSIIALGQRMELTVIAEGVETAGQLNYLAQYGCHEIQGYYFSRPLPSDELRALLQRYQPQGLVTEQAAKTQENIV